MTNFLRKMTPVFLLAVAAGVSGFAQTHSDGLAAMQLENWDKAISVYSALTKQDPTDQVAWLTLGSAYVAKGDKKKAQETFDSAFNAKAEGPLAMIANGRVLLLQGKMLEADEIFKKAKKYGKKDVAVRRLIGDSYVFGGPEAPRERLVRAETELKEAMEISSKDFATLMSIAYCYKEMPNGGLAAQHYEYAVNIEPQNPLPLFMLAKVYRTAKLGDKFLNYVDKAIAVKPNYSEALRAKAEYLYFDKKWEAATEAAKNLVGKAEEVTIEDEMLLANLLYITKDCVGCSALVEKILKKDPSRNYLRRLQAYCDYDNGKFPEGLRILEDFFKQVAPDKVLPSDYEYLAKLQIKSGRDTAAAISNYRKTIEVDSSKWPLHEDIAQLYYKSKNYCNAAIAYQAYIDSLTETQAIVNASYFLGLSHYYCTSDSLRFVKAEKAFAKITELVPDAGLGWAWRAKAMSKLEPDIASNPEDSLLLAEFGKARPYFEKFVEIGEKDPVKNKKDLITSYEYLSSYYFLKKDDVKAREYLQKLFIHDPENSTGKEIQKFLDGETPPPPPIKSKGKK
jgi:tetratricopeptide (TPR) repeat protein